MKEKMRSMKWLQRSSAGKKKKLLPFHEMNFSQKCSVFFPLLDFVYFQKEKFWLSKNEKQKKKIKKVKMRKKKSWRCRASIPVPSECKSDAIPISPHPHSSYSCEFYDSERKPIFFRLFFFLLCFLFW